MARPWKPKPITRVGSSWFCPKLMSPFFSLKKVKRDSFLWYSLQTKIGCNLHYYIDLMKIFNILFKETRQMTTVFSKILTVMIIMVNFEPLAQVFINLLLQYDKFFSIFLLNFVKQNERLSKNLSNYCRKSLSTTKGMFLLPRGIIKIKVNTWIQSHFGLEMVKLLFA